MRHLLLIGLLIVAACGGRSLDGTPGSGSCTPHQSIACVGPGGCAGGQECNSEGTGYLDCNCGDGGTHATVDAAPEASPEASVSPPTFTMKQTCGANLNTATLYVSLVGNVVTVQRDWSAGATNACSYSGILSTECDAVVGTYDCGQPISGRGQWSAYFTGQKTRGGCVLPPTWSEQEAYEQESPCSATWTQTAGPPLSN